MAVEEEISAQNEKHLQKRDIYKCLHRTYAVAQR